MENINQIIGKNLLILRKSKKLTQMELADKFNYSDKSISKWEAGDSMPSVEILYELAKFYGVGLDYLITENHENTIIESKAKQKKQAKPKMFPTKLVVTLLAVCAVWVVATTVFVCLKMFANINYTMAFLWAIPASAIILIIFNSIWGHYRYLFPVLTILLWSLIVSFHVQLLFIENIWPIYFLGIPLQVAIILWGALVKRPRGYFKKQKEEEKKKLEDISSIEEENK